MKRRFTIAVFLVIAAVVLPIGAWYVVGSRDADREAERLQGAAVTDAADTADRLANLISSRLEDVREIENARPYFHYQNLYHDPRGAAVGASVQVSPLAEGNADPLVLAYFQIDKDNKVSLPTRNDDVPALNYWNSPTQVALVGVLEDNAEAVNGFAQASADGGFAALIKRSFQQKVPSKVSTLPSSSSNTAAKPTPTQTPLEVASRLERYPQQSYSYNRNANTIYNEIQSRVGQPVEKAQREVLENVNIPQSQEVQQAAIPAPTKTPKPRRKPRYRTREVVIEVGTFQWHTVDLDGTPRLVALRVVKTPDGPLTQGFLVETSAVQTQLATGAMPAALVVGAPSNRTEAKLDLPGVDWSVSVEADNAVMQAVAEADRVQAQFHGTFMSGSAVALLAGFALLFLVWKSEELAQQRSRFAASAAHELRTPLAGIRMYGEMLAEDLGKPERSKDYAKRVASEADRLARIVKNVLGFTRLEQGNLNVTPEPGDLHAALTAIVEQQAPTLRAAGVELIVSFGESLPTASFDRDATAQIIQNLLDNAEKYTREAPDRRVEISAREFEPGGSILVTVRDNGPGMSPRTLRRLFRPFQRGQQKDAPAGLGLGLSLARGLARSQGGDLTVMAPEDGGASFTLSVPLAVY